MIWPAGVIKINAANPATIDATNPAMMRQALFMPRV
jgi:hypothetical protein